MHSTSDKGNRVELEIAAEHPVSSPRNTPLLFIHGMCHAAWCWQENFLPYFARHDYVSYALSLRGHGESKSKKPLRSVSLADYVYDISTAVNNMKAPPVLIGHSMGGLVVQKYLETHHQIPGAVLLASVPPLGLLPTTVRFAFRRPWAFIRMLFTMTLYPLVETPEHCKELLFSDDMPDAQAARYQALMQDESYRAFWDGAILNLPRPKLVKAPMLVLGTADDRVVTVSENELTGRVYSAQVDIFRGMGHDMMLEPGWQAVADRILAWLQANGI